MHTVDEFGSAVVGLLDDEDDVDGLKDAGAKRGANAVGAKDAHRWPPVGPGGPAVALALDGNKPAGLGDPDQGREAVGEQRLAGGRLPSLATRLTRRFTATSRPSTSL